MASASSAVMKSPGTNSPSSSTKKQRSASPSQAMPSAAPSLCTLPTMNSRFSSSSGLGWWSGNVPSGSMKHGTAWIGSRGRIGASIVPAMPLAPSRTTFSGCTAEASMKPSTRSAKAGSTSRSLDLAAPLRRREVAGQRRRRAHLVEPRVAADRQRPAAHDLHAVVLRRVVRGGHDEPAVEAAVGDREVHHLGADEADVDDVGAAVAGALDRGRVQLGRRQAHVAPDRHAVRLEDLDVGAGGAVGAVGVELVGDEPADVVGLEDGWREGHGLDSMPSHAARTAPTWRPGAAASRARRRAPA